MSNYYDAKGNRIANLSPPKLGTDAVNKDYIDNSIKDIDGKTLRVKDKPINALPNTEQRANKILAFDENGQPITVLPESGSASDVLLELNKKMALVKLVFHNVMYAPATIGHKLKNSVWVTDAPFNAKMDGVTDDTDAFQKLLIQGK